MSRIKEMTREVVREGEDRRATFTAQGMPLQIYKWWRRHTKRTVAKENFCHYCRVVAIWAPLMFIRMMLAKLFSDRQFWICMSLAAAVVVVGTGIAFPNGVGVVLIGLVIVCAALAGLFIGFALAFYLHDKSEFDDVSKWVRFTAAALIVPTLPTVVVGFIVASTAIALISKTAKRFYRWMGDARLMNGRVSPFGVLLLLVGVFILALSVVGSWWMVPLAVLMLVGAIYVGKLAIEWFGYRLAKRRTERRLASERATRQRSVKALQPVLRTIFVSLHPEHQEDEGMYWSWYRWYIDRVEGWNSETVWNNIYHHASPYYFPDWSEWSGELLSVVTEELEGLQRQLVQTESRVGQQRQVVIQKVTSPFVVAGDFVILLAQFIRVTKWKICPVVELPKDS